LIAICIGGLLGGAHGAEVRSRTRGGVRVNSD
jgi:hypothetical protein